MATQTAQTAPAAPAPNPEFARLASDAQVERTAKALEVKGFRTFVAASGESARQKVHEWLEPGAEVFDATSRTLDAIGLSKEIHAGDIPYNALHDQGYPSLGCSPCTRAIKPGEDVRAGRWWWENPETKECGLHKS